MKKHILSIVLLGVASACANYVFAAEEQGDVSVIDQIKKESSGVGRFRGGLYGSIGYADSMGSDSINTLGGISFEAGAYTMFTPIKGYAEVEVGAGGVYIIPSDPKGAANYDYGLTSARVYGGPVIPLNSGKNAIGFGVYKDFSQKIKVDKTVKDKIAASKGKVPDITKDMLENGLGVYVEWQWLSSQPNSKSLVYTRLNYGAYDRTPTGGKSVSENYGVLSIGFKF